MKKQLSEALSGIVAVYSVRLYNSYRAEVNDLDTLKADIHDRLAFCYHHLPADASGFIQRFNGASTMSYALTCLTAAAQALMTSHELDVQANEAIIASTSNVTAQVDSLAMKTTTRHVGLLDGLEQLQRYDMDQSGCDSCGQTCGADMVADEYGDYLKREDVIRLLGGNPEEYP